MEIMGNKNSEQFILTGFMGCGKSVLLETLRKSPTPVGLRLLDSDDIILKVHAVPHGFSLLGDFIRKYGMEHFRQLESEVIRQCLADKTPLVLALGGGGFSQHNRQAIELAGATSIWLDTPFEQCFQRIQHDKNRPLVSLGLNKLQELYGQRLSDYQLANIHLPPNQLPANWADLKHLLTKHKIN
jgi:shikimate kinase